MTTNETSKFLAALFLSDKLKDNSKDLLILCSRLWPIYHESRVLSLGNVPSLARREKQRSSQKGKKENEVNQY